MKILWVLLLVGGAWGQTVQKNLKPGDPPIRVESNNYPRLSKLTYPQSFVLYTSADATIVLNCPQVMLHGLAKQCFSQMLLRQQNGVQMKVCHSAENFYYTSPNMLMIDMMTGTTGAVSIRCFASAVKTSELGPPPTYPNPFFSKSSESLDTFEHGVTSGNRNTTCPCGWANRDMRRIVGGEETGVNQYPFIGAIIDKFSKFQFCGCTIITERFFLTAAHCTKGKNPDRIAVVTGAHNIKSAYNDPAFKTRQEYSIEKVIEHENYDDVLMKNDISLLVSARKIIFSREVGPACLSPVQTNIEKQYIKLIGWGRVGHNEDSSPVLKSANVRVVPLEACGRKYSMVDPSAKKQVCTYGHSKSSCMGDSGGPVVWRDPEINRYTLRGAVSFGVICATSYPSVHTDISAYYDWIQRNIQAVYPDERTCSKL